MRYLLGRLGLVMALSADGVDPASADGPFMITFPSFCDCITVRTEDVEGTKWIYGTWDWLCNGSFTPIGGGRDGFSFGAHPTVPYDAGFAATFVLGAGLFDFAVTIDGLTNLLVVDDGAYDVAVGACASHRIDADKRSLMSWSGNWVRE